MDEVRNPRQCEILVLEIGGRHYGLPASEVRELLRVVTIESLPLAPLSIEGIINLRGKIVPVLDIRARLRLPPKAAEPSDYLVVIGMGASPLALRIDQALELKTLDVVDVAHVRSDQGELTAVAKLPDRLMPLLDPYALLSSGAAEAVADAIRVRPVVAEETGPS